MLMPVKKNQIAELLDVVLKFVPESKVYQFLTALEKTDAYQTNASYRKTIQRLVTQFALASEVK